MVDLNIIRKAGKEKKLLFITASEEDGSIESREVEPYSFRHSKEGNTLFFGWDVVKKAIRSFRADRIIEVRVTSKKFTPRFPVEV
jgi:predicted DNA-binding transcriptional regulator YafY